MGGAYYSVSYTNDFLSMVKNRRKTVMIWADGRMGADKRNVGYKGRRYRLNERMRKYEAKEKNMSILRTPSSNDTKRHPEKRE